MAGGPGNRLQFAVRIHNFPHGNAMPKDVCFPTANRVAETNPRKFLFQSFLLQVKAAQG